MTREEAIEYGQFWLDMNEDSKNSNTYKFFQQAIKALEQEPKTGHWIIAKGGSYLGMRNACCSNCKDFYTNDWNVMNYCPNCGAKMKSEVEDGNDD